MYLFALEGELQESHPLLSPLSHPWRPHRFWLCPAMPFSDSTSEAQTEPAQHRAAAQRHYLHEGAEQCHQRRWKRHHLLLRSALGLGRWEFMLKCKSQKLHTSVQTQIKCAHLNCWPDTNMEAQFVMIIIILIIIIQIANLFQNAFTLHMSS